MKTVSDLVFFYLETDEFTRLAKRSQYKYKNILLGDDNFLRVRLNTLVIPFHVEKYRRRWAAKHTDAVASFMCKIFQRVWSVGFRYGVVASNPFVALGYTASNRRTTLWPTQDIALVKKEAEDMGYHSFSLFIDLCYETCQRPGDILKLTENNIVNGRLMMSQEKTGNKININLSDSIIDKIHNRRKYTLYLINHEYTQKPYGTQTYHKIFKKIIQKHPHLKGLQIRDLRRTGLTELGEAGCTEDEIMAVSGHKNREMVSIYVVKSPLMADNAMAKRRKLQKTLPQ